MKKSWSVFAKRIAYAVWGLALSALLVSLIVRWQTLPGAIWIAVVCCGIGAPFCLFTAFVAIDEFVSAAPFPLPIPPW
jgi:hypothetical protein